MIKAVVFKNEKHGHLMTWLKEFRDSSGKKNDSEAIRTLMQLGYEYLQLKNDESVKNIPADKIDKEILKEQIQNSLQESLQESIEISQESLKKELMAEVILEINNKINNQMLNGINTIVDKLSDIQTKQIVIPQQVQQPINTSQIQSAIQETVAKVLSESKILNTNSNNISNNTLNNIQNDIPVKSMKKNIPKVEGNALLANLLGNADR